MKKDTFEYDERNRIDYDKITELLDKSLDEIERNPKLPATQAQLSKMTKVHRNTIRNRKFPKTRLDQIREKRKTEKQEKKHKNRTQIYVLEKKLESLSKELAFWFAKHKLAERDRQDIEQQFKRTEEARKFYENKYNIERENVVKLKKKNQLLTDIIEDQK